MIEVDLHGRTALITGASRGLGKAMALALGSAGARLAFVGRDLTSLEAVAETARGLGAEAQIYRADVTDEQQVEDLTRTVIDRFGPVHILINNAGSQHSQERAGVHARGMEQRDRHQSDKRVPDVPQPLSPI